MEAYGWSADYVDWELDGAEGQAYCNWARENKSSFWGDKPRYKTEGYVKQEYQKLMQQYYDSINKNGQ